MKESDFADIKTHDFHKALRKLETEFGLVCHTITTSKDGDIYCVPETVLTCVCDKEYKNSKEKFMDLYRIYTSLKKYPKFIHLVKVSFEIVADVDILHNDNGEVPEHYSTGEIEITI